MANRRFQRHQSLEKEIKELHLKVTTDGSGDVSSIDTLGIASVSHAANVYTITLDDKFSSFRGAHVLPGVSSSFNVGSVDVQSAKTVEIEFAVTQASTEFFVTLILKNTDVR